MALPADVQAALDRLEPALKRAFLEAVAKVRSAAQLQAIIGHLEAGNIEAALTALQLDRSFYAPLDRAISEAFWQGGVAAIAGLPRIPNPFPVAGSSSALTDATHGQSDGSGTTPEH